MKYNRKDLIIQAKSSCAYQNDLSCDSIKRYVKACDYINNSALNIKMIEDLGNIISSRNNGFRRTPAVFINGNVAVHYSQIARCLENLLYGRFELSLSAERFFIEFEKIHPFNDGNGRVGEIIYWWMTGGFNCPHSYFSNHD